ncbi:hypothetical protein [Corynebacterium sp. A21]|uniref:hypothetical protein n=1 Tax=Corynebacterium sp. A21 TaxID=3457318 RepID=UPI003FD3E163
MDIKIDTASIEQSIQELNSLYNKALTTSGEAQQATLNGAFSGVSGLDQLGSGHGSIITGGPGSAGVILSSYAEQIEWLTQALQASYTALTGQNTYVSRGMDIADEGGAVGADAVSFPQRPMPRFENFSFIPPVVMPALSIDQLAMEFSATNIGASTAAAATWKNLSTSIAQVAAGLHGVAGRLAAGNSGDVIAAAVEKVSAVATAGDTFAMNAAVMTTSVQQLAAIKSQGAVQVNLARTALAAIVLPAERIAAEQAFLATFPASFSPSVVTGVPPIRNLMVMEGGAGGGGEIALGMETIEGDGPAQTSDLNPAGGAAGALNTMQSALGGSQFSSVNQGISELSRVGNNAAELDSLVSADELRTTGASVGSPLASGISGPGALPGGLTLPSSGGFSGGIGAGIPPLGGIGAGSRFGGAATGGTGAGLPAGSGPRAHFTPLSAPNFSGGLSGSGRLPGVLPASGLPSGPAGSWGATSGSTAPVSGMGAPMMGGFGGGMGQAGSLGSQGMNSKPGALRPSPSTIGGAGSTSGGAARLNGAMGSGVGGGSTRVGLPSGNISAVGDPHQSRLGSASGAGAAGTGASTGTAPAAGARSGAPSAGRGMMPMMGSPMGGAAGNQGKATKVKTVTSAVEEEGNIAALLGERGPVVPGVIGAWVRG